MMRDEHRNQVIRFWAAREHVFQRVVAFAGAACVGFFAGFMLGVDEEPVL